MQGHLEGMQKHAALGAFEEFLKADLGFHFAMADAAGNPLLSQFMTLIRNLMSQWISLTSKVPGVADEALNEHRSILEAVRNHKPREARDAMVRHLKAMARHLANVRRRQKAKLANAA
jgi:GntR family transcriptional regulator, transcriptional repressor for pyruvate dehydrogenase complex